MKKILFIIFIVFLIGCINPKFRNGKAYYDKNRDIIYFLFENNQGKKEVKIEMKKETTDKLRNYICIE